MLSRRVCECCGKRVWANGLNRMQMFRWKCYKDSPSTVWCPYVPNMRGEDIGGRIEVNRCAPVWCPYFLEQAVDVGEVSV